MINRIKTAFVFIFCMFQLSLVFSSQPEKAFGPVFTNFHNLPFAMPVIPTPKIPARVFDIQEYGAREGLEFKNTKAINRAIEACSNSGGGSVIIPEGVWVTGPIHLKSNVNLHINEGAKVLFSTDPEDYLPVVFTRWEGIECYNYSPLIYANGCKNIAITGKGVFDGQGEAWWPWKQKQHAAVQRLYDSEYNGIPLKNRVYGTKEAALRPQMLQLINCDTVLLENYTCQNSPFWTNHLVYCQNVIIRNIVLINPEKKAPNTDGLDIESSKNIHVQGLYADVGDDAVCLKSGMNEDGWRVNRPSENIVIENCYVRKGHGGIVFGSDIGGGIKNVFIAHCLYDGTAKGIRIKSMRGRGGYVDNVRIENIEMRDLNEEAIVIDAFYNASSAENRSNIPPHFRNISFKNIYCDKAKHAIIMKGLPEVPIEGVTFENITINSLHGSKISDSRNLMLENVTIQTEDSIVINFENCQECTIRKTKATKGTDTFLYLSGEKTQNITLKDDYLGYAKNKVILETEVPKDAVKGFDFIPETISGKEGQSSLTVLPPAVFGVRPHDMMKHYLEERIEQALVSRKEKFDSIRSKEAIIAYQENLKSKFRQALGEFPERTPLNPKITGTLKRAGYSVEKLLFESQPRHYVSAICFVPQSERFAPPYPGVLVPCGHSANGKAYESYQTMGAFLALNGMVALVFDPVEQGERLQVVDQDGVSTFWGTHAHNRIGASGSFLGQGTATFEIWDGMRGIDYLQSRPDVDAGRIGCTGNSGGGTQTACLMALDDRIDVAAPSCFITDFESVIHTLGVQDAEQNIYGQLGFGMDHADYLVMRAPKPTLIAAGIHDFFDIQGTVRSFQSAKKIYEELGAGEDIALFENNAGHNYNRQQREAIVSFLVNHLCDRNEEVHEPDIELFTDQELTCSPQGQVMLIQDARSVYDMISDMALKLEGERQKRNKKVSGGQLTQQIRTLAGIRPLEQIPDPQVEYLDTISKNDYFIEKMIVHPEEGIVLPALFYIPKQSSDQDPVLYLNEQGKYTGVGQDSVIESFVKKGIPVLAVDIRGYGETRQIGQRYFSPEYGEDGRDVIEACLLGKSYVGMRCEDILVCARWLSHTSGSKRINLLTYGNVGVPALHAAALEKKLFNTIKIENVIRSWMDVVISGQTDNQMVNSVYGALHVYDLPDLINLLPSGKFKISYRIK